MRRMEKLGLGLGLGLGAACLVAPMAAKADVLQGNSGGINWQVNNNIIGVTSTATIAGGGNPIYQAPMPQYSGVVALIMNEGAAGNFICSGSLLSDHRSILTAGHCVSQGGGAVNSNLVSTTAYFYGGSNPDTVVPFNPIATAVTISDYHVDPLYTGQVVDDNDMAVLTLSAAAPSFAKAYDLYTGGDMTGQDYNVAGYGGRSDVGGNVGVDLGVGRLRQGDNRYDFRLGDSDFGGFWNGFFGTAEDTHTYLSDFDNGLAANDTACKIAAALGLSGPKYCNTGLGALEVSTAGGDSGGPQFIDGKIASVTGFGLTFGGSFGDIDGKLDSSFGEFNGFIPTNTHLAFIEGAMVPEPMAWALMILGFGLTGAAMRRRRSALTSATA